MPGLEYCKHSRRDESKSKQCSSDENLRISQESFSLFFCNSFLECISDSNDKTFAKEIIFGWEIRN